LIGIEHDPIPLKFIADRLIKVAVLDRANPKLPKSRNNHDPAGFIDAGFASFLAETFEPAPFFDYRLRNRGLRRGIRIEVVGRGSCPLGKVDLLAGMVLLFSPGVVRLSIQELKKSRST